MRVGGAQHDVLRGDAVRRQRLARGGGEGAAHRERIEPHDNRTHPVGLERERGREERIVDAAADLPPPAGVALHRVRRPLQVEPHVRIAGHRDPDGRGDVDTRKSGSAGHNAPKKTVFLDGTGHRARLSRGRCPALDKSPAESSVSEENRFS